MIDIRNLDFVYPGNGFRLRIPALTVEAGRRVAVIGPSGSGKTNLVAGIAVPASGELHVDDLPLSSMNDAQRRRFRITRIGMVFQDFELIDYLSVLDNILHPYRINRALTLTPAVRDRARQLAADTGLADKLRRHPHQLSQGERQRAAVCRALLPGPRLLLADEPTGNLDPAGKGRILTLLSDYARKHRATLVTVTHDHSLLEHFDEVIDFQDFQAEVGP